VPARRTAVMCYFADPVMVDTGDSDQVILRGGQIA
jgi:hypothetical protein